MSDEPATDGERAESERAESERRKDSEHREALAREHAARREAEAASELKDRFLASLTHELRTPLATLLLWEKVLRDEPVDAELRGRALGAIHDSAVALSQLVDNLLDFARAVGGKLSVDRRALAVGTLVAEALAAARPAAAARGITIEADVPTDLPQALADAVRLRQALDNLVGNAIKFSRPGGRVQVRGRGDGERVRIEVRDQGEGIAPEDLARLFQPFHQVDQTLTRAHGGLGLGLTLARRLVELQGGELRGDSPGLGRGAAFTIDLAAAPTPADEAPEGEPDEQLPLRGLRLLLVDDEPRVLEVLKVLLMRAGAEVSCAGSAEEARSELQQHRPDALLSDAVMPGEDGFALMRRLRGEEGPSRDVPAIAITGYGLGNARERALDAGFDAICAKPIDYDQLTEVIAHVARLRPPPERRATP